MPPAPRNITTNVRAFTVLVRNELFRRVQLVALERYDDLAELEAVSAAASVEAGSPLAGSPAFTADDWADALDPYFAEYDRVGTDADARSSAMILIGGAPGAPTVPGGTVPGATVPGADGAWHVRQILADPAGDHDWGISAVVDLVASIAEGTAVVRVTAVDRL